VTDLVVDIDVDDLEKGIEFYRRGLGLRLGRRLFGDTVAEMLGARVPIYLLAKPAGSAASSRGSARRDYRRHWTPVHLDFAVPDLDEAVRRAAGAGATLEDEIRGWEWGRVAILCDPFGHGFCLIQFTAQGHRETFAPVALAPRPSGRDPDA
jgi:catechol 2,3-dioxygenase-like lactoylglutathione lyase family enzyme